MKNIARYASLAVLAACTTTLLVAQSGKVINNWRAEHSRDTTSSTNVKIDEKRGLETTGTPAKAVWVRQFTAAGPYMLKIRYTPIANRPVKLTINGAEVSTKGLNAKPAAEPDLDCEKASWRVIGEVKFVQGANTLVMEPLAADGKLPHICQFEAELEQ